MLNLFCTRTNSVSKTQLSISSPKWVIGSSHAPTHTLPISSWVSPFLSRNNTRLMALRIGNGCQAQINSEEVKINITEGKLLSELSTWGIGGPAKYFVEVHSEIQLLSALRYFHKHNLRFFILGRGSNCLFDDRGFDGCVILNRIDFVEKIFPATYQVGSGYSFNQLGLQCSKDGFTGLEFATGIPGTVGGAVFMNAGAGGQETADVLKSVEITMADGRRKVFQRSELSFSYRKSPFQHMQNFAAIVCATFELASLSSSSERKTSYAERRKKTTNWSAQCWLCLSQPYNYYSVCWSLN